MAKRREVGEHEKTFRWSEILDVVDLLLEGKWPDNSFGDNECDLWSEMRREFAAHGMDKCRP